MANQVLNISIYALCDPDTDEVRYIGQSVNPADRWGAHRHQSSWMAGLRKRGAQPVLRILEEVAPENAADAERKWIERYSASGRLTNTNRGGGGRPAQFQTLQRKTITLPAALIAELEQLGEGNLSAGIRRLYERQKSAE